MAKQWFTTLPDVYYMRQSRKGGRHELLFTCLALGFVHFYGFKPLRQSYWNRNVTSNDQWNRAMVNNQAYSSKL